MQQTNTNEHKEVSASIELKDEDPKSLGTGPNPGPGLDLSAARELTKDPQGLSQVFQAELRRIKEQRGKVLTGKLLGDFVRMIGTFDNAIDHTDKGKISKHVVDSLADADIEVLAWTLTQNLSGGFANALSARIVERTGDSRLQGVATDISHADPADKPKETVQEAPEIGPTSQTADPTEGPAKTKDAEKKKELSPAEMEEKARRLAHLKASLAGILQGKRDAFQDKEVMRALPGAIKQLFSKGKFGTTKQIIERLGNALSSEDPDVRNAVSDPLSRILDIVPPEVRVHTAREILQDLVSWITWQTSHSPAYERICAQLEKVAQMLVSQHEVDECVKIIEALSLTHSAKPQTDEALVAVANRVLENIATGEVIEILVADFQSQEEQKREQAGRCLSMMGSPPVERLLDVLSDCQVRSEQTRIVEVISKIGEPAAPALTKRIEEGAPWHVMFSAALLLGRIGGALYLEHLEQLLGHEHAQVREEALNSICTVRGGRGAEIILSHLPVADDEFKTKIVAVLGARKYRKAVQPLVELIESRPSFASDTRDALEESICIALGRIGSEEAIPALKSIVKQNSFWSVKPFNKKVRKAAQEALEHIKEHKEAT